MCACAEVDLRILEVDLRILERRMSCAATKKNGTNRNRDPVRDTKFENREKQSLYKYY